MRLVGVLGMAAAAAVVAVVVWLSVGADIATLAHDGGWVAIPAVLALPVLILVAWWRGWTD